MRRYGLGAVESECAPGSPGDIGNGNCLTTGPPYDVGIPNLLQPACGTIQQCRRATFVGLMQNLYGVDPSVQAGGAATASVLAAYFGADIGSAPTAWFTGSQCPPGQEACAYVNLSPTQVMDPGSFYDAWYAAEVAVGGNLPNQGNVNADTGTNYVPLTPNATTASSASQTVPAGSMPGETQPSPVSGSAAGSTVAPAAAACVVGDATWALFGDTSCFNIGSTSIGTTTALVLAAAAVAAFLMFGGKR